MFKQLGVSCKARFPTPVFDEVREPQVKKLLHLRLKEIWIQPTSGKAQERPTCVKRQRGEGKPSGGVEKTPIIVREPKRILIHYVCERRAEQLAQIVRAPVSRIMKWRKVEKKTFPPAVREDDDEADTAGTSSPSNCISITSAMSLSRTAWPDSSGPAVRIRMTCLSSLTYTVAVRSCRIKATRCSTFAGPIPALDGKASMIALGHPSIRVKKRSPLRMTGTLVRLRSSSHLHARFPWRTPSASDSKQSRRAWGFDAAITLDDSAPSFFSPPPA